MKFGISPFGIWKPGYPSGITGSSQYDELYADAKLWLNKGWVDYFSPQSYWPIESKGQSFPALLQWWSDENTQKRHLWPGLNTVEVKSSDRPREIVNQIEVTREIIANGPGEIHYSMAGLTKNPNMLPSLKNGPYKDKAVIPASPWLKPIVVVKPSLDILSTGNSVDVKWNSVDYQNVTQWILYTQYGDQWETEILDKSSLTKSLPKQKNGKTLNIVAVKSLDRIFGESQYNAKKVK